jgi:hypothetical protein
MMNMSLFEIAFSGEVMPGTDEAQVRANLARLFQADERRIAQLFSGRRVIIKNKLDAAAAEKYRVVLSNAGAKVDVLQMPVIEEIDLAPPPAAEPSPAVQAQTAAGGKRVSTAPRDEVMAAFMNVDAPDFGLAPVGTDLQDQKAEKVAPALDLSQFSLAPVGSDMGEEKPQAPIQVPDTSHLKLM